MSAYSNSEYDAFCCGEFRKVRAFCPVQHRYVTVYAATIIPAKANQVSRAKLVSDTSKRRQPTVITADKAAYLSAYVHRHGEVSLEEVKTWFACNRETVHKLIARAGDLAVDRRARGKIWIVPKHIAS